MERAHQARLQRKNTSAATRKSGPEMVEVLKEAGICNYSYFFTAMTSCSAITSDEKGVAYDGKSAVPKRPVVDRWNEYMKDILELEMDPVTGAQPKLEQVFRLD